MRDRIATAIRAGNYAEVAAEHAGIDRSTYYKWMDRGRRGGPRDKLYVDFFDVVTRASADAEVHAVATIRSAMPTDWRAALAYLERRHPDGWRRKESVEHSGRIEQGVALPEDEAELRSMVDALRERREQRQARR